MWLMSIPDIEVLSAAAASAEATGFELTILMPCLNEAETITTCIAKARVADNGSRDGFLWQFDYSQQSADRRV
jgi:hypothetical protein